MQATISWNNHKLAVIAIETEIALELIEKKQIGDGKGFEYFLKKICFQQFIDLYGKNEFYALPEAEQKEWIDKLGIKIDV